MVVFLHLHGTNHQPFVLKRPRPTLFKDFRFGTSALLMNGKGQLSLPGATYGVLSWHESQTEIGSINPPRHPPGSEPRRDEEYFWGLNGRSEHSPAGMSLTS
jgi:hypothetical protein